MMYTASTFMHTEQSYFRYTKVRFAGRIRRC